MHKSAHSTPGEALKSTLAKDETLEATEGVTAEENSKRGRLLHRRFTGRKIEKDRDSVRQQGCLVCAASTARQFSSSLFLSIRDDPGGLLMRPSYG